VAHQLRDGVRQFRLHGRNDRRRLAGGLEQGQSKGAPEDEKIFYEWHQFDPGVVPNLLHTGAGSPTGILFTRGISCLRFFRNQIIHCDAGPRVVRAYPAQPDGAGFKASTVDIVSSTEADKWFRPSECLRRARRRVYIADWNDAGVGGHNMEDRKLDAMTGRVYRVAPKGSKPSCRNWIWPAPEDALRPCNHPARRRVMPPGQSCAKCKARREPDLLKLWNGTTPGCAPARCICSRAIKGSDKKLYRAAIKDGHPDLRITGLRNRQGTEDGRGSLRENARQDRLGPGPTRSAPLRCGTTSRRKGQTLAQLAAQHDGKDRWYLEALGIGADKQWDKFFDAGWQKLATSGTRLRAATLCGARAARRHPPCWSKSSMTRAPAEKERARCFRSLDSSAARRRRRRCGAGLSGLK